MDFSSKVVNFVRFVRDFLLKAKPLFEHLQLFAIKWQKKRNSTEKFRPLS